MILNMRKKKENNQEMGNNDIQLNIICWIVAYSPLDLWQEFQYL